MYASVTVPAAMAISGAALSPSMGKMTRSWLRLLLALFNVRLGVWVPNPARLIERAGAVTRRAGRVSEAELDEVRCALASGRRPGGLPAGEDVDPVDRLALLSKPRGLWGSIRRGWAEPGLLYLLYEGTGRNSLDRDYVYVTDGGHWENLGLVELLRRGCTRVYCFDAAGDDLETFNTLGEAVALARSELGVEVIVDPVAGGLFPDPELDGYSRTDVVVGAIKYPNGVDGVLVFAKAAMPVDAPWDVKAYRGRDRRFPSHSTGDQFFNDEQFESYRALGAHAARRRGRGHARCTGTRPSGAGDPGRGPSQALTRVLAP